MVPLIAKQSVRTQTTQFHLQDNTHSTELSLLFDPADSAPQSDVDLPSLQVPGQSGRKSALALALLPLVAEAAALGLCLGLWLKMNVFMAFAGALVLAAVCPALVGVTMHEWNQGRLGTRQGTVSKHAGSFMCEWQFPCLWYAC